MKFQFYYIKGEGIIAYEQDLMFSDFEKDGRVRTIDLKPSNESRIKAFVRKLCYSKKFENIKGLAAIQKRMRRVFFNPLALIDWDADIHNFILIQNGYLRFIDFGYIDQKRKEYSVSTCALLFDFWDSKYTSKIKELYEKHEIDYLLTIQKNDAEKYGFIAINIPYSILLKDDKMNTEIKFDLYYIGGAKERLDLLHNIYDLSRDNKVSSIYRIANVPDKKVLNGTSILYNQTIGYMETLNEMNQANCILEVLDPGESGATARYYEAVCYNKKLLTNNADVKTLSFYNPDYIHVFENPSDIDWGWVKERKPVDYQYNGQYSPAKIIDLILELDETNEELNHAEKEVH